MSAERPLCMDGEGDVCGMCEECMGPPNCPGMGIDDLCTWPDVEGCGLCIIGKNPAVYGSGAAGKDTT